MSPNLPFMEATGSLRAVFHNKEHLAPPTLGPMWRALLVFVGVLLAVGLYVLVTGAPATAAPAAEPSGPRASDFGFALAAGAIALAATMMVARPRFRMRR